MKEATHLARKINSRARCYILAENLRSCPSRTNILRAKRISCKYESAKTNRNSNTYDKFNTEVSSSIDGKPCRPMTSTHFAGQSRGSTQLKTVKRLQIIQLAACSTLYKLVRSEISWTTKSNTERQMYKFHERRGHVGLSPPFYYARDRKQRFCSSYSCLMWTNSLSESLNTL